MPDAEINHGDGLIFDTISLGSNVYLRSASTKVFKLLMEASIQISTVSSNLYGEDERSMQKLLLSGDTWVVRGSDCRLRIRTHLANSSSPTEELDLHVQELTGRALKDAELWDQLGLTIQETNGLLVDESNEEMVLCIRNHLPTAKPSEKPSPSSLLECCSLLDVMPPGGIAIVSLHTLFLHFSFTSFSSTTEHPPDLPAKSNYQVDPDMFEDIMEYSSTVGFGNSMEDYRGGIQDEKFEQWAVTYDTPTETKVLTEDNHGMFEGGQSISFQGSLNESPGFHSNIRPPGRASEVEESILSPENDWSQTFVPLIDAAFRSLISKNPTKISSGVKLCSNDIPRTLSEICPALFCPGYLVAASRRMCFMDLAAEASASFSILQDPAVSPRLVDKIHQCRDAAFSSANVRGTCSLAPEIPISKPISKNELWMALRKGLLEKDTARRLKPLRAADAIVLEDSGIGVEEGEILDWPDDGDTSDPEDWPISDMAEQAAIQSYNVTPDDALFGDDQPWSYYHDRPHSHTNNTYDMEDETWSWLNPSQSTSNQEGSSTVILEEYLPWSSVTQPDQDDSANKTQEYDDSQLPMTISESGATEKEGVGDMNIENVWKNDIEMVEECWEESKGDPWSPCEEMPADCFQGLENEIDGRLDHEADLLL